MKIIQTILFLLLYVNGFAQERQNVLLISSYNSRFPSFFHQINGIKSVLDTCNVNLDVEFMDSKRFASVKNTKMFKERLRYKLAVKGQYNLVLVTDDNAFKFVSSNHSKLFSNLPVLFCSVNNIPFAKKMFTKKGFTGVVEDVSVKETLEQMFAMFPYLKEFYVIWDDTRSCRANYKKFLKVYKQYFSHVPCKNIALKTMSYKLYEEKLKVISKDTPVLYLSAFKDKNGKTNDFDECVAKLNENLKAPVFSLWRHGMGKGFLGGKVISHYEQGKNMGLMAAQILEGKKAVDIPLIETSPNVSMYDFNQMVRFNISKDSLPNDAVVLNEPNSFYQRNKLLIHLAIVIFTMLVAFIIILSANIFKRRLAELELKKHQNNLESLIQEKTKHLEQANTDLQKMNNNLNTAISELKNTQSKLVETEKMASLGVLTAGVAHEINNPLNFIKGAAMALTSMGIDKDNAGVKKMLSMIHTGVERATSIVKGLNQFSREGGDLQEDCNVNTILENSLAMLNYKFKHKVFLEKNFDKALPFVKGNVGKLHQVFVNILANAVDAIEDEGGVSITTKVEKQIVVVKIKDSGCGIPEDQLKEIIQPFYTTKKPGEGTGLGMSIVYSIIKEHNGELFVDSQLGKGTTITINLPVLYEA